MKVKRKVWIGVWVAALLIAIIGCSSGKGEGGGEWEALDKEEQVSLRVMYWSSQ